MKKLISLHITAALLLTFAATAQTENIANGTNGPGGAVINTAILPTAYSISSGELNFDRTWVPLIPISNPADPTFSLNPGNPVYYCASMVTSYTNAKGQPIEDIKRGNPYSNGSKDIITPYDNRPFNTTNTYLPSAAPGSSQFQEDPFSQSAAYYTTIHPGEGATGFSQTVVAHDINKVASVSSYAPGLNFVGKNVGTVTTTTLCDGSADQQIKKYWY